MRELEGLKQSFEVPLQWFHLLKKHLHIRKGALLLPDSREGIASPWAIVGYDRTTAYRLRIPLSYLLDLFRNSPSPTLLMEKDSIRDLANHFSTREVGLLRSLLVHGVFYKEKLIALFLISDSPVLQWEPSTLKLFFTVIDELSASILYAFRSEKEEKLNPEILYEVEDFRKAVPEDSPVYSLNPKPLVDFFRRQNLSMDPFHVHRDIASFLSTALEGSPVLIHPESSILYFVKKGTPVDDALWIHQLESSLKRLFPELSSLETLGIEKTHMPFSHDGK